jgi:hypothetical protein
VRQRVRRRRRVHHRQDGAQWAGLSRQQHRTDRAVHKLQAEMYLLEVIFFF